MDRGTLPGGGIVMDYPVGARRRWIKRVHGHLLLWCTDSVGDSSTFDVDVLSSCDFLVLGEGKGLVAVLSPWGVAYMSEAAYDHRTDPA